MPPRAIAAGTTGSGKTSTLYTSLQEIATEDVNVVTVEDPVEYVLPCITQLHRHLNKVGFMSFRSAAIEKVLAGATTLEEVLRVLPRSALNRPATSDPDYIQLVPTKVDSAAVAATGVFDCLVLTT